MEIKEENIQIEEWEKLEETANTIIKNASRDLILWNAVLKSIQNIKKKNAK